MESIAPIIAINEKYPHNKDLERIQQDQRDADMDWFKRWLYSQAIKDSKTKAYEVYQRMELLASLSKPR